MTDLKTSKGVEIIGTFNNESRETVDRIKKAAAALIDVIDENCPDGRRKSISITEIETAAMYSVKSLFEG